MLCHSLHGRRLDLDGFGTWALYTYSLVISHEHFYRPQDKYYTWWHHPVCLSLYGKEGKRCKFHFTWIVSILPLFISVFIISFCLQMERCWWISVLDSCIRRQIKEFWRFDCQTEICMCMKIMYALTCICIFETWKAFWDSFAYVLICDIFIVYIYFYIAYVYF